MSTFSWAGIQLLDELGAVTCSCHPGLWTRGEVELKARWSSKWKGKGREIPYLWNENTGHGDREWRRYRVVSWKYSPPGFEFGHNNKQWDLENNNTVGKSILVHECQQLSNLNQFLFTRSQLPRPSQLHLTKMDTVQCHPKFPNRMICDISEGDAWHMYFNIGILIWAFSFRLWTWAVAALVWAVGEQT